MLSVVKEFTFDAAHFLPGYDGNCRNLHGHTYKLQVGVTGPFDSRGMVCDFQELKEVVTHYVDLLDHSFLNEIESLEFPKDQPTAERMVYWLALNLIPDIEAKSLHLSFIRLYETPTSYAEWRA